MIFRNKGDREAYLRERTISSMQANKYILEGDWISTPYFTYIAVTEETDVPLQNGLFAKMLPFPLASKSEFGRVQIGNGLEIENGVLKHPDKHSADIIEPDSNNRFVTDEQIDMWTGKVSKEELAEAIENFSKGMVWKESVPTFDDIATTYPNPQDTWTVITKDKNDIYMYESDTNEWKYLGSMLVPEKASADKDGLMSKEHFVKLEELNLDKFSFTNLEPSANTVGGLEKGTVFDNMPITELIKTMLYNEIPETNEDFKFDNLYFGYVGKNVEEITDLSTLTIKFNVSMPFKITSKEFVDERMVFLFKNHLDNGKVIYPNDIKIIQNSPELKDEFKLESSFIDVTKIFTTKVVTINSVEYIQAISLPIHSGSYDFILQIEDNGVLNVVNQLKEEIDNLKQEIEQLKKGA